MMIVDVRQPEFVALIDQVDVRSGPTDAEISEIHAALDRYAVIVLRGQDISDAQQLAFCERFGSVERLTGGRRNRLGTPGLVDLANINEDDRIFERADERHLFSLANQLWHTDSSFKPVPARYSMLSCREATTSGGETEFADLRAAYEALSSERKAMLDGLVTEHAFIHSRRVLGFEGTVPTVATLPAVHRPIVHVHAGSERASLYLASHASHILGWPVPEGRLLLFELIEYATQPQFVFRHTWRRGDFVLWDNRCTMHRGLRYPMDQRRDVRRVSTVDVDSRLTVNVEALAAARS
jgi:alpha-ketoglutarate-dependent 2,4-dichlorophenoxyacetate dioxygenase